MRREAYSVILVPSTSHAVRLEQILRRESIACKLIPVPRHISSDCGVCIRVHQEMINHISNLLIKEAIAMDRIVDL